MDLNAPRFLIPSLCIALDDSSERILCEIRRLHLRSNDQLASISEFLRFALPTAELISVNNSSPQFPGGGAPAKRSEVLAALAAEHEKVENLLDTKLSLAMDHSRLINAGIAGQQAVPLNIFLLADGKDMVGGGLFIPLTLLLLKEISKRDSAKLHILLNVASFQDDDKEKNRELFVFSLLEELKELKNPDSELLKYLCETLKIEKPRFDPATLYLFHDKKMGPSEISTNSAMEVMIGNSLLHLLSDNTAQSIARLSASTGMTLPITGIGTALVAYDPETLQAYCGLKKSVEIIDTLLLGEGLEGAASAEASRLLSSFGDVDRWTKEVFNTLPDVLSQVIFDSESNNYKVVLKEIKLEKIRYLDFQSLSWLEDIEGSEQGIIKSIVSASEAKIQANAARLMGHWAAEITQFAINLPQQRHLYPGGIDTAKKSLLALSSQLINELINSEEGRKEVEKGRKKPVERLKKIRNKIKSIIDNIPDIPKFIAKIPEEYQEFAAATYYHLVYLIPILKLRMHKKEYQELIQTITGIDIQLIAADAIRSIIEEICGDHGVINERVESLNCLEEHLKCVNTELNDALKKAAFVSDSGWMEYFRVSMVDKDIAEKVYADHERSSDYIIAELIDKANLFSEWQESLEPIQQRLSAFTKNLFRDLWELDLQDLHRVYGGLKKNESSPLNEQRIRRLLEISQPLLRPNFSITSDHGALPASYFLKMDDEWQEFYIPDDILESQNWDVVRTGDPHKLIVSQALHKVDFLILEDLFSDQKKKYLSLSEKERAVFSTVSHRDFVTTLSETDNEIVRQYQWHFSPKGSRHSYTYTIELAIDLDRYRRYAAKQRVIDIQDYKIYAQTDMPEINHLALEFQKIFADVKWSTYNQAFCVLKFVQNAITYKRDLETKQKPEWPRYPIETLVEGVGDCEDVSILCASILVRLGFDVMLLLYPTPCHMAFGVAGSPEMVGNYVFDEKTGKKYYYGEATSDGWMLGEIPKDYLNVSPEFIKVELLVKEENASE